MSNEENNVAELKEQNSSNMTIDAFGNYVNVDSTQTKNDEKKGLDKKPLFIICGVILAVAVLIIVLNSLGGSGAKGVAQKYAKAYKDYDAEAIVDLLPKELVDKSKDSDYDLTEELKEEFKTLKDAEIEITSSTVEDEKVLTKEELEDVDYMLELYDIKPEDVTEAVIFTIKLTAKNKDGETKDADNDISVIKINGNWKLIPVDIS